MSTGTGCLAKVGHALTTPTLTRKEADGVIDNDVHKTKRMRKNNKKKANAIVRKQEETKSGYCVIGRVVFRKANGAISLEVGKQNQCLSNALDVAVVSMKKRHRLTFEFKRHASRAIMPKNGDDPSISAAQIFLKPLGMYLQASGKYSCHELNLLRETNGLYISEPAIGLGGHKDDKHCCVFDAHEGVPKDNYSKHAVIKIGEEDLVDQAAARRCFRNHSWWKGAKYVKLINAWELKLI